MAVDDAAGKGSSGAGTADVFLRVARQKKPAGIERDGRSPFEEPGPLNAVEIVF